jgi:hypothetical protein
MSYRYLPGNGPIIRLGGASSSGRSGLSGRLPAPGARCRPGAATGAGDPGRGDGSAQRPKPRTSGSRSRYPVRRCPRPHDAGVGVCRWSEPVLRRRRCRCLASSFVPSVELRAGANPLADDDRGRGAPGRSAGRRSRCGSGPRSSSAGLVSTNGLSEAQRHEQHVHRTVLGDRRHHDRAMTVSR